MSHSQEKFQQNLQKITQNINAPRIDLIHKLEQGLKDSTPVTLTLDEMKYLHKALDKTHFVPVLEMEDIGKLSQ